MLKTFTSLILLCFVSTSFAQMPVLVKDINTGPGGFSDIGNSAVAKCTNGNELYFNANDSVHGRELWVTDGTNAATHLVKDINPGDASSDAFPLGVMNGKMLFGAWDDGMHYHLWSTDGTAAGTVQVHDVSPLPIRMTLFNGKMYFAGRDSTYPTTNLWVTDGTTAGTHIVKELNQQADANPANLIEYNGRLYFQAYAPQSDVKIWSTDGTDTGTRILDNVAGNLTIQTYYPHFAVYKNRLWFAASDYTHGTEVWSSDGTDTGTHMLKDIAYGSSNCFAHGMTVYHNLLCFAGYGGLYSTDGTDTGTHMFSTVALWPGALEPFSFTAYNDKLYFDGADSLGGELWVTDATDTGTYMIKDIFPTPPSYPSPMSSAPYRMKVFNGLLYFEANDTTRIQIWTTDGTTNGTQKLWPSFADSNGWVSGDFEICNNMLFFDADYENAIGAELYRIGGPTAISPVQLANETVTVFPNPTKDIFTVRFSQSAKATIKLLNMSGVLLKNETVNGLTKDIDLTGFPPGIYLLDITNDSGHMMKRVAKL
ncbi:ELWxxDGT repeat protein [Taibaiella soli]|uniref:Secretion system C-terminal sorting domain-containing protein n=1 Tax=Taibaiella soli TaxID=1649169 RepID=A0A2W2C3P3_9BACT|nr:ELWxxDGT repeat protein [Taibaiella soli]PZF74743.1 hypothetical protein DN068_00665 [Taibaiella soli]